MSLRFRATAESPDFPKHLIFRPHPFPRLTSSSLRLQPFCGNDVGMCGKAVGTTRLCYRLFRAMGVGRLRADDWLTGRRRPIPPASLMTADIPLDHPLRDPNYVAGLAHGTALRLDAMQKRVEALEQLHQAVVDLNERFTLDPLVDRVEALEQMAAHQLPRIEALKAAQRPPAALAGVVERMACLLARRFSDSRPGTDCTPFARDVLREVAAAARLRDLNKQSVAMMTWEGVAQWLEQEADR